MKKTLLLKCAVIGICLIITTAIFGLFSAYTHPGRKVLYLTPYLHDANGWNVYMLENGIRKQLTIDEVLESKSHKTYFLSRTLTADMENHGHTFLMLSSHFPCAIFLDGQLLYTNCPGSVTSAEDVSLPDKYELLPESGEFTRCTLPSHFAGREITIATTTGTSKNSPSAPKIILSSEIIESEASIASVSHEMIPAAGFAVTALLLMAAWLFTFLQGNYNCQILLPIAAALLQAFSHLLQLELFSFFRAVSGSPLTLLIPPVSLLLLLIYFFLQIQEKKDRILFGCILGVSSAITLISPAAKFFIGAPFDSLFFTENKILYCPLIALLIFAFLEAKHENTEMRLFLAGLAAVAAGILLLYIGSMLRKRYYAKMISFILSGIPCHTRAELLTWCTTILFFLSALSGLHKIIRSTVQVRTSLALQTERSEQLDRQLLAQKNFYDAKLSHEKEIRSLRHDMDGHLSTLSSLLSDNKLTEAKNYLGGITKYHNEQTSRLFSSNAYINAVLQNHEAQCARHHIALTCHIGIGDYELPATELCLILNNALDNAFDASLTLPEAEREIKVQAAVRQNLFLLRISNPFHGNIETDNGLPVTTKQGKQHGYGLSNIRQAAEHRGGSMEYHIANGYFVLDVELPIK